MLSFSFRYDQLYKNESNDSIAARKKNYSSMVIDFYNLVTAFYEFGWGHSFHFAPRHAGESFEASIARAEFYLALRYISPPHCPHPSRSVLCHTPSVLDTAPMSRSSASLITDT